MKKSWSAANRRRQKKILQLPENWKPRPGQGRVSSIFAEMRTDQPTYRIKDKVKKRKMAKHFGQWWSYKKFFIGPSIRDIKQKELENVEDAM